MIIISMKGVIEWYMLMTFSLTQNDIQDVVFFSGIDCIYL